RDIHSFPTRRSSDLDLIEFNEIYIVLEFATTDLKSYLRSVSQIQQKFIPITIVKKVLFKILEALCICKRYGLVHRDIKPANILLDRKSTRLNSSHVK